MKGPKATALRGQVYERFAAAAPNAPVERRVRIQQGLIDLYDRFLQEGLADPQFAKEINSPSEQTHLQRVAELLLAQHLWDHGFSLTSASDGPDFRATKDGRSVWIELITPLPTGIDPSWLQRPKVGVWSYPHKEICLRYTAAIKEKHQKLVGIQDGKRGYLTQEIVQPGEPYVIAVNQQLLGQSFGQLGGISGAPAVCEAVFGVGLKQLHINKKTGEGRGMDHQHRPAIPKAVGEPVPAEVFFDPAFAPVSAVMALQLLPQIFAPHDPGLPDAGSPFAAIAYNPLASAPLPVGWLPAQEHWVATLASGEMTVSKVEPRGLMQDAGEPALG